MAKKGLPYSQQEDALAKLPRYLRAPVLEMLGEVLGIDRGVEDPELIVNGRKQTISFASTGFQYCLSFVKGNALLPCSLRNKPNELARLESSLNQLADRFIAAGWRGGYVYNPDHDDTLPFCYSMSACKMITDHGLTYYLEVTPLRPVG